MPEALTYGTQGRRREGVVAHLPPTPHLPRLSQQFSRSLNTLGAPGERYSL